MEMKVFGGIIFLLVLAMSLVIAPGVARPYADSYPLKLAPGESMIFNLTLLNEEGGEPVTIRAELTGDGGGIARLVDSSRTYNVPAGTKNVKVPLEIKVPSDIEEGGIRQVSLSFKQVPPEEGGMVSLAVGFSVEFPVEVVGVKESALYNSEAETPGLVLGTGTVIAIIIILLIIIAVIWQLAKRRNQKRKR